MTTVWRGSLWESGENVFSASYFTKRDSHKEDEAESQQQEVYSIKGMRWQAIEVLNIE